MIFLSLLAPVIGMYQSIALSALIFLSIHPLAVLSQFASHIVASCIYGVAWFSTGSLLFIMFLHGLWNFGAFVTLQY